MNNNEEIRLITLRILLIAFIFGISYVVVYLFPLILTIALTAIASTIIIKRESHGKIR
jgi:hypothetical protein